MTTNQDKHTRWDGAIITAGGFHHVDCPCDGCKALAKAQQPPSAADEPVYKKRLANGLELTYAMKLEQRCDELLAALELVADKLHSAANNGGKLGLTHGELKQVVRAARDEARAAISHATKGQP